MDEKADGAKALIDPTNKSAIREQERDIGRLFYAILVAYGLMLV